MRHVMWISTVVLGVQGLALNAHAEPDPNRGFNSAVTACNTVLDPYAGVEMATAFPASAPSELYVGVDPFPDLLQYIDAVAADPPGSIVDPNDMPGGIVDPNDKPGSLSAIVDPNDKFLRASFNQGTDGSRQLDVDAGPGTLQAVFWIPPDWDLQWIPPDWDFRWIPPDWDLMPPVVVQLDDIAGTLTVNLTNPPDPDKQLQIVVDSAAVGSLSFVDSAGNALELRYPEATRQ